MITAILFIYIGVHIGAPWWYLALAGVIFFVKLAAFFVNVGKKVGELSND